MRRIQLTFKNSLDYDKAIAELNVAGLPFRHKDGSNNGSAVSTQSTSDMHIATPLSSVDSPLKSITGFKVSYKDKCASQNTAPLSQSLLSEPCSQDVSQDFLNLSRDEYSQVDVSLGSQVHAAAPTDIAHALQAPSASATLNALQEVSNNARVNCSTTQMSSKLALPAKRRLPFASEYLRDELVAQEESRQMIPTATKMTWKLVVHDLYAV